jgi:Domain of unknown function (DUF4145)
MYGEAEHALLECRGCETVFYRKISSDSENTDQEYNHHTNEWDEFSIKITTTFPRPETKTIPQWLGEIFYKDTQLYQILREMYKALDDESYILTSIGLRTALDRAMEVLGILPDQPFAAKLKALLVGGWIGSTEHSVLEVVTDAGNAAAHRAWSPSAKEIQLLTSSFEVFLQRAFIVGDRALSVKQSIPAKQK